MKKSLLHVLSFCLTLCLLITPFASVVRAVEVPIQDLIYVLDPTLKLDEVTEFHDGVAAVRQGDKWAYINSSGKLLTQFKYDFAAPFNEGRGVCAVVTEESRKLLKEEGLKPGDEFYNPEMYLYYVDVAGRQHIIPYAGGDPNKTFLVGYNDVNQDKTRFVSGCIPFGYNYIGPNGQVCEAGSYHDGNPLHDGLGLITSFQMTEGLFASIVEAIGWTYTVYVDANGELALNLLSPELFGPVFPDKSVDWQNTGELLHQSYRQVETLRPFNQGLAPAYQTTYNLADDTQTGGWGFIDKTGSFVIPPHYQNFMVTDLYINYQVFNDGIAMVQDQNGNWGGIDKTGQTVIPFQYEAARVMADGLVSVQKGEKWGAVDSLGKTVIAFSYDSAFTFHEGMARVESGGKYGFVDTTGKLVIPCVYDSADTGCFEGLIWVNQNGKEGYLNSAGQIVVPLTFDGVYRFYDGVAFVRNTEGRYGIIANPLAAQPYTTNQSQIELTGWVVDLINKHPVSLEYRVTNNTDHMDKGCAAVVVVSDHISLYNLNYTLSPGEVLNYRFPIWLHTSDIPEEAEDYGAAMLPYEKQASTSVPYALVIYFKDEMERREFIESAPHVTAEMDDYIKSQDYQEYLDPYEAGQRWLSTNFGGNTVTSQHEPHERDGY